MDNIIRFPDLEELNNKIEIRELTMQHGLAYPSDEELIMLILGSGTKDLPIRELAKQVFGIVLSSNRLDEI